MVHCLPPVTTVSDWAEELFTNTNTNFSVLHTHTHTELKTNEQIDYFSACDHHYVSVFIKNHKSDKSAV